MKARSALRTSEPGQPSGSDKALINGFRAFFLVRLHFSFKSPLRGPAQGRRHHFPSFLAAVQTALRGDPLLRIIGSTAKVARKVRGREGGVGTEGRARNDYYLPSHAGERKGVNHPQAFSPARKLS